MSILPIGRRRWREIVLVVLLAGLFFFSGLRAASLQPASKRSPNLKLSLKKGDLEVIKNLQILLYYDLLRRFELYSQFEFFFRQLNPKPLITLENRKKK